MKKAILLFIFLMALSLAGAYLWISLEEEIEIMSPEELGDLSSRKNDFALASFKEIVEEGENSFISPYSIHTALMLAHMGSEGKTKEEMEDVLVLSGAEEESLKEEALGLKRYLENISQETEVSIANSFFLRDDIPFLEGYKDDGVKYFEAELKSLPETGENINRWVREQTKDKIEEIIDPGPIERDVIAYLVNAIYFKGTWQQEFDKEDTTERIFYGTEEKEVEMMENKADYRYKVSEDMKAVTLEYKDGDYLFHAFMPIGGNLSDFYRDLDRETLRNAKPTNKGEIILRMPKFKLEEDIKLSETLQIMGMVDAFNKYDADFSRMVDTEELEENVYIGEVYHSSFLEVDEEGTEAAAATAVEMRVETAPMDPTIIELNKPFFFTIEEAETETILFMGQLVDPF